MAKTVGPNGAATVYEYNPAGQLIRQNHAPGTVTEPETVRRVMREERLCAKVRHKFVVTTPSRHSLPVAENVLARGFAADGPNRKWAADIACIRVVEGGLYLAGALDLYSRRVAGWSMSERLDTEWACPAPTMAMGARAPVGGGDPPQRPRRPVCVGGLSGDAGAWGLVCGMNRRGIAGRTRRRRFFRGIEGGADSRTYFRDA